MYQIVFTKQALRDAQKIKSSGLKSNAEKLLSIIAENPYQNPPPYEKLIGELQGCFSRRINIQHRLVYTIYENENVIKVLRMWTHYE
jgi:Txe/YoeB family toxin of toxin-antitoxin system